MIPKCEDKHNKRNQMVWDRLKVGFRNVDFIEGSVKLVMQLQYISNGNTLHQNGNGVNKIIIICK